MPRRYVGVQSLQKFAQRKRLTRRVVIKPDGRYLIYYEKV